MREGGDVITYLNYGQSEILWPIQLRGTTDSLPLFMALRVSRVHIYQREGEESEVCRSVLCGHCGGSY